MLKKILLAIAAVVIVLSFNTNAALAAHNYDYKKGVFDTCRSTADASNDNNLSNYVSINGAEKTINLCSTTTVFGIYIKSTGMISTLKMGNNGLSLVSDLDGYYPIKNGMSGNKITISGVNLKLHEIEIFTEKANDDVSNVVIEPGIDSVYITFNPPDFDGILATNLTVNGKAYTAGSSGAVTVTNLKANTTYTAVFEVVYRKVGVFTSSYSFKTLADVTSPDDITNLAVAIANKKDVNISFTKSASSDISHYEIYRNDTLLVDKHKTTTYKDTTTAYNTSYTYKVVAVDTSGNKSVGVSKTVKTQDDAVTNVSNLSAAIDGKKDVKLSYKFATDTSYVQIYRDNKLLVDNYKETSYTDTTTAYNTSYTYKVIAVDASGKKSSGASQTIKTPSDKAVDISNLSATIDGKKDVKLSYKFATDTSYVQIYRDNKLLVDNYKETSYTDTTTAYNTSYTYKVIAVDASGATAAGVSKTIKTPAEPSRDVASLKATATSNSVSLKWSNPNYSELETVTIYRKQDTVMAKAKALFNVNGDTPIFTTNGTEFEDLTVTPDTKYTYRITTTIAGVESAGVTVDVKTKPVTVEGGEVDKDANGDYVITWTAPTTGKIKVLVDGTQYKIVAAADKKVVIPASVMVYDFWGNPKVTLVPVNDAGEDIGTPAPPKPGLGVGGGLLPSPDELKSVIDVTGLVQAGMSLIALIGGFVLLRLAFLFVPKLIKMIRRSWR